MPVGKRRRGKQATHEALEPPPASDTIDMIAPVEDTPAVASVEAPGEPPTEPPTEPPKESRKELPKEPPLILTSDKRRGVYECDYCHSDISQVPRIRCAVCIDFDLCLDCFATTDHEAAVARIKTLQDPTKTATNHEHTHGYRVADSTRYQLFPSTRTVMPSRPPSCIDGDEGDRDSQNDATVDSSLEKEEQDTKEAPDVVMQDATVEKASQASARATSEVKKDKTTEKPAESSVPQGQEDGSGDTENKEEESVLVVQEDPKCTWTVEEDLRLLDAIATCGLGNWADIAETISGNGSNNKTPKRCMERYLDDFLGRYGEILPPYTIVDGDDDETAIVDDGKDDGEGDDDGSRASKRRRLEQSLMRSYSAISMVSQSGGRKKKQVVPTCSLPRYEEVWPEPYLPPISGVQLGQEVGRDARARAEQAYVKALNQAQSEEEADKIRKEWMETRLNQVDGPTVLPIRPEDLESMPGSELAGYMPRRGDFDMEWDNDAETVLADMEFSPNDLPQDRQHKLQIIEIYNSKLDERERRNQFLLSRHLVDYRRIQKKEEASPRDERYLLRRIRLFEGFHTPGEHKEFIAGLIQAKLLRKELAKMLMYRRMGIKSLAEAAKFELDKERHEFHKNAQLQKDAEKAAAAAAAAGIATVSTAGAAENTRQAQGAADPSSLWKQYRTTGVRRSASRSTDNTSEAQNESGGAKGSVMFSMCGSTDVEMREQSERSAAPTNDEANVKPTGLAETERSVEAVPSSNDASASIAQRAGSSEERRDESSLAHSPGYELLFPKEVAMCEKLSIMPAEYLDLKSSFIQASLKRDLLDKEGSGFDIRTLVKIDAEKRGGDVLDFMVRAGWISSTKRGVRVRPVTPTSSTV